MSESILFPNASINGIFFAAIIALILPFLFFTKSKKRLFALLLVLPLVFLLFFSKSRAGYIGILSSIGYLGYLKTKKNRLKVIGALAVLLLLFSIIISALWKPGSTNGRLHIYSLSMNILEKNWVKGIGLGKFKAVFNEQQAVYFSGNNINSRRALLADNTFYAFNEYLQLFIEAGLPGMILLILMGFFTWRRYLLLIAEKSNEPLLISAWGGLICIALASLFSYPLHVISIQFVAILCTGVLLFYPLKHRLRIGLWTGTFFLRLCFIALTLLFFYNSAGHIKSIKREAHAFSLQNSGYKGESVREYEALTKSGHSHGYNFYFYAERLFYSGNLSEAEQAIENCRNYYADNNVYKLKALIEREMGKYEEAEQSYLTAAYMVPNRMGNRYELMNFYISRGDTGKARDWAKSIINMPVKIPSERTAIMLNATRDSLSKWNFSNY